MNNDFSLLNWLIEGTKDDARGYIFSGLVAALLLYVGSRFDSIRAARALRAGDFDGPQATVQTTVYEATGEINPATGKEFRDQKIYTEEKTIDLTDIFDKKMRPEILKYFNKAAQCCTPEEPVIFQHLDKVVPEKHCAVTRNVISSQWIGYFSALYNDTRQLLVTDLGDREVWETRKVLPLLVHEKGTVKRQFRVLLMPVPEQTPLSLPDFEDVRFRMDSSEYEHNEQSRQANRYTTNKGILDALEAAPGLISDFGVNIRTGRVLTVPEPSVAG